MIITITILSILLILYFCRTIQLQKQNKQLHLNYINLKKDKEYLKDVYDLTKKTLDEVRDNTKKELEINQKQLLEIKALMDDNEKLQLKLDEINDTGRI